MALEIEVGLIFGIKLLIGLLNYFIEISFRVLDGLFRNDKFLSACSLHDQL